MLWILWFLSLSFLMHIILDIVTLPLSLFFFSFLPIISAICVHMLSEWPFLQSISGHSHYTHCMHRVHSCLFRGFFSNGFRFYFLAFSFLTFTSSIDSSNWNLFTQLIFKTRTRCRKKKQFIGRHKKEKQKQKKKKN